MELFKDKLRGEITDREDVKLQILQNIACMAEKMTAKGKDRVKQLTTDTGKALAHVCLGLVDMTRSLLGCGTEYVLLGWFTTDPLEKFFSKLRQGSGGTYRAAENVGLPGHAKIRGKISREITNLKLEQKLVGILTLKTLLVCQFGT